MDHLRARAIEGELLLSLLRRMSSGDESRCSEAGQQGARRRLEERVEGGDVLVGPYEGKTRLLQVINSGAFGQIFLGEGAKGQQVAVKVEHPGGAREQLLYEGQVYRKLAGGPGIPRVTWYGMHGSHFNVLVMDLLGSSLQELFLAADRRFSLKTVLLLLEQMVTTLAFIHETGFVHRDISTSNFMMGAGPHNAHKLYLVDYGLAKKVSVSPYGYSPGKLSSSFFRFARPMVGTARFCSVFCQRGEEASWRDDLESLGYVLVYLLRGCLPWQGLQRASPTDKLDQIYQLKLSTSPSCLCEGLPEEFETFMNFVRTMKINDIPNYQAIQDMFRGVAARESIQYDYLYDWTCIGEKPPHCLHATSTGSSDAPSTEGAVSH